MSNDTVGDGVASGFELSLGNEQFEFSTQRVANQKITGAQIIALADKRPIEDFVVLQHLTNHELRMLLPDEAVNLGARNAERFFVLRSADLHRFFVNALAMEWPLATLSGAHIRFLGGVPDEDELLLDRKDGIVEVVDDDQEVHIADPGVERFKTRPAKGHITIFVDAEPYVPPKRIMTPNEIIEDGGKKNPATNYLVQITPHGKKSYKDKGTISIRLKNGEQFQIVSVGPTPVSDTIAKTGVSAFIVGLQELGYQPQPVSGYSDHITFDYKVETGVFAGRVVRLGLIVPSDFPMTPPTGPHLSPDVHPINSDGLHPKGHIHRQQAAAFQTTLGGNWQYWSRPFREWAKSKQNVAAYMNHIWQLWDTQ